MALNYLDKAAWDAGVYKDKGNDDDTQQDTSSEDSGYSASGILSAAKNFLEHPFQGMGTVIAPNYTPRPLDDSVYSDIPGTPVASGQFGELEDESVRDERMKDSADYMAANWPRLYGGVVAADEGLANVVGGIQNAVGGGNGILTNVQRAEEGMQNYRDQWNNEYGDSYFLNPNKFATDAGSVIGSSVPIMGLSALMPGAAVAGGTRALTSALSRAGLGRLAMSEAGQALIADTVRSPISSLADSLSEYGTVVNDMMQNGMSEDEARRRAIPMSFKNMAIDTFTVPLELGVMKGGKGIATGLLGRSAEEGVAKSIAKGAARTGMLAGASGLTEGYQEGAQNALENDVEGKRDGGWYNPFTWTNEDWESARGGFVGGALMGVPGNVAAGFHPEAKQAPLSAESQEQVQGIKDTLSHGKPAGMSNAAYNAYIELANSGNPDLIKQAASSLESFQQSQEGSQESTDDAATEAYKDYETYDQKQKIENFLDNNTVEQIGGEKNFNWLMGVLRNGTPEEVQHAYDTVIAAEKATAEQEAKNRPASGGGSMSPNTGNAMANIVIQAANDSGVEPRLGLAIAARESGGDDVNAISMPEPHDGVYGVMQAQEETVSNMGLDSQYPDWKTDPYQNAMVGMAILKAKIDGENGDVWAGVRDYDGAGEEAEQYRQLVKNNYDNMGDTGGGGGSATYDGLQLTLPDSDEFTDQSGNVSGLTEDTRMKLRVLDNLCYQKFGQHLIVSSSYREDDPNNHGAGVAFDVSGGIVDDSDARQWLEQAGPAVGLFVIPEYQGEAGAEFAHGDNVHFSNVEPGIYGQTRNAEGHWSEEHAAPSIQSILKGGASSGVSGKVTSDNGQFERELDQAAQEAKSDMDKIQAQSDQAINEIMNDDSTEKTAQDARQDAENAQKQAEEGQQSVQDDVVPDVAQTIRDTSNNIDEINTLDGMFTKDSNGNDKFIDTPENRDFIKTNYKDEIAKAVNDAMSKKKAPSATPAPKSQQQASHARLGRILSTYDRKDPKFKEYMNTFRNGTEQEQQKLADDLQTTQELERANSLKGNPLTTQQDQNIPQNVPQQAVEAPKQTEQVNTPVQEKESLETQKKRKIYLAKKQKLMERVPAGKTVKVHASTNDAGFDATYKIVPAGDITASHDMNYAVNDLYPAEYQPRDRNRPQMRGQVEKMTKGMKPELLAESQFVNEGAPVVNNSGVVLNGNGRVMAVQKAYKGLADAHKKSAKAYKDYLISIAPSLGIAPEKVQSVDHPVLVRQAADNADTNAIINSTEPAGSGRVHQQEAGRVQSQEKEGNEVDEKSKQSDHVDTEPQQTESKDTEGTHAEEGSQGDVQEEISKFHNVLDDEKSTPKQVIDAYKSVVDKVIASADGSRKNDKMGDKIVTDEYQSLTNSKHWNAFMNEDGGRNWHEVATINADAHRALHAIINTAGVKAKEAPSSQGILPYKQAVDDIMDRLDHKKLTPARAINKLKIIMKDANAARWGEFKAMEAIESKEKLSFDDYKMALDLANDAMKKANDMRLEASRNRKARKTAKELESATEETKPTEQPKEKAGFTDDEIKTLTDRGFNRWTKKLSNGKVMDRLYIKPEYLGLELTRYKSGNISSAKFNGETISNSEARRIEGTKCYVDVATKEVVCDREDLKQAAQEVIDDALSKEKSQVPAQAEKGNKPDELRNKLSNGGKQAYDYAIDKLSNGNEKVAQSAKENAFIYARMAERWSEIMHEYGNKTYSPEDYTKSHPIVMGQQSRNAQLERAFEQRAWHGSPYDFDSFDLGYIGAGEGDQVHGWGLYFAKDKKISKAYKDIFGYKDIKANVDGKTYHMDEEGDWTVDGNTVEYGTAMGYVLDTISNTGNKEKAIADLESSLNKNIIRGQYADEARKAIDILKNRDVSISKGETLYSVEIPNNAYLLDEDKPIYNQSKTVKRSLLKAVQELPEKQQDRFLEKLVPGLTAKSKETIKAEAQLNTMQSAVNGLKELDEKPLSSLPAFRQRIRKSLFEKIVGSDNVEKVISDTDYRNATIKKLADDITKQGKIIPQLHKKDADRSTARRKELKDNLAQTINTYGLNGKHFYESLSYGLTGDVNKQADASKYLDKYGIKGIKYIGNTDGQCFVIFDDKAVQIIDKYNQDVHNAKAAYDASTGAIRLFDIADQSSFIHESAHMFLSDMERLAQKKDAPAGLVSDLQTVKDWAGYKPGQMNGYKGTALEKEFQEYADAIRKAKKTGDAVAIKSAEARWMQERFARGFERYIADGKAPNESLKNVFEKFKDWMVSIYQDLKNLGKKPPKEIQDIMARMITPERLDMSDEKKQTSVRKAGQQLTRSKEDLKAEIKEAFPNAKEIKDEGDRMTFTMPNGSHIVVDVKNEILLTDKELAQAKKDHHIDDNGNVVVEGYAQLHGKDAYMALSQGSRKNTGFHEAYHLAEGAVLTDREKAAIKKAIPDAEKRADKYAEWVEARKHGRGTAWGKLFQKIKDFAAKMRKIFTGAETVNDIFRQIESGKVWERGTRDNSERRYAVRQDDQEEAPVKPQDIIDAINDIVHIYEGSRLTDKERKELRESSKFDPDQKQAIRPQATDLYDRHAHAGFNRMGYFNLSNYGRILALHLDNIMQLKSNLELANKVLDRQDKNAAENKMNGVNEHLTPAQARQNAVMDFGAMMIRNPELARETYPAYSKIFDEGLEQHPDLKEKLDKVIQLNETYQGQTAAERAAGSIAREKEKVQLRKHPKEWLSTHFDKFYTNWVDDKHAFAKVVARAEAELGRKLAYDYDVHKQAQMAINVASSRALLFLTGGKGVEETYKVLNKVYGHAIMKNVTMKDIMDALNKVSKEDVSKTDAENAYDALGNYLIAMRTEELEKHYHDAYARSAGFDEEGTREIIQNTPKSIKKIAQMYWDINTNIVNILQQQGLISKDLAGKLRKYKHYCPMYRDMSDGITDMDEMIGTIGVFNKGGGYANVSNGIKRIEGGGKRPILDPITSLSQMAVSMISKCERNDVAKTFVKLGQDFAGLGDVVVRDPTLKHADPTAFAFTVWQNGEQVVYRTTPEIYDALTNNDAQTNRFTIKMASSIAQTLRTGATISPSFIVRNLLRDTMSATVNSKTGFYLPFVDNVRGAWKLHFDKEFSAEYHASGASMSTYMRADADSSRDLTKELLGHKYDSYPVVVKQVRQLISYAWHKYEKFGNLIEDSTRAGEFRRARNQGLSIDQAGQLAREITLDFSRHGKKGQIVNKYVPFFNATIQGADKFIRTFKDNPMRAILNTVIWIILPSLGLWAINHDDDWYKELDENTKYTNWAIPLPGGTHLLIPKPQEVGILFGSGIEAVLNQMTGTDPHGMKEWARQYAEAMTPSLYPAVVRPLIEWMTNYSFWTGRNLVPASLQKAPSEMQFTSYTSELAKSLGDTWLAKSIKLSPIAIDNWISGWFGSAGRFIANMLNDPISYVRGNSRPSEPAKYWYEMPVIGSFIRQNGQNSEYVNRMYEIQKDMNDDYERSDAGKQRKGKKSSSNKPKELKQVDTAVSSVSKLNKEIKAIRNDPKKDPDRKRQEIDQRQTKINDLAKKVVLKFDK